MREKLIEYAKAIDSENLIGLFHIEIRTDKFLNDNPGINEQTFFGGLGNKYSKKRIPEDGFTEDEKLAEKNWLMNEKFEAIKLVRKSRFLGFSEALDWCLLYFN